MTLSRTGLGARQRAMRLTISRDRQDGGGGKDTGKADDKGGKDDDADDDDDELDDDDEDDDSDDEDDDDEDLGPKGKKALNAEREANKRLRRENRALRKAGGKTEDDEDEDDKDDTKTAVSKAEAGRDAVWKPLLVRQAASAALASAGLIGKPDRLLRLLDLEDIDVDPKTGEIDGLADQIKDFRREYRELFRRKGSSSIDAGDRDDDRDDGKAKTATERQAQMLVGR